MKNKISWFKKAQSLFFLKNFKRNKTLCNKTNLQLIIFFIVSIMIILPLTRIIVRPAKFIFNINANSSIFSLETTDDNYVTKWRINDAIICSRTEIKSGNKYKENITAYCHSWNGYRFTDPELTLELQGVNKILLETKSDGSLYLALRGNSTNSLLKISFPDKNQPDIILGPKINIVWPVELMSKNKLFEYLLFPFAGTATIGRDVNWASHGMLRKGKIHVFTSDLSSTYKRNLIDQIELMLGDQVRLESILIKNKPVYPMGFVRYKLKHSTDNELEIVAFGKAKQVRIERFGDNGYDFEPSIWSRILKDQFLLAIESALFTVLMLLITLLPFFEKKSTSPNPNTDYKKNKKR